MSKIKYALKNFMWSTANTLIITLLNFATRSIFIQLLGTTYLGLNSLFTNVLGMLSLAELGFGIAISFKLYEPLANHDKEKIKSLMLFYKKAYQLIALVITILGLFLIPFLPYLTKGVDSSIHVTFIYLIFLFNTVSSYLLTYKSTLLNADQRNYQLTKINLLFSIITLVAQLISLLAYQNYYGYLIISCITGLIKNIYINHYVVAQFPYLKEKNIQMLPKSEIKEIQVKIKATMMHKIGDVCINQTDNIVISSFIHINLVGIVSNYTLIINTLNTLILGFFNACTAGLGNLFVTTSLKRNFEVYKVYDFLAFCFFGFSSIALYFLLSDFIMLWIGSEYILDKLTILLLCLNFYLVGLRVPLGNIKQITGVVEPDKYVPLIQSIVNLVISTIGAMYLGIHGIYIGTIVSSLAPNIWRPIVVYKDIFKKSSKKYFLEFFKRLIFLCVFFIIQHIIFNNINLNITFINFIIKGIILVVVFIILLLIFYFNSNEFRLIKKIIIEKVK